MAAMFSVVVFAQDKKMTEIKTSQLPKEITKWVTQNLPGGNLTRAGKIEEKGTLSYVAVVESRGQKHAYLFDKDGNFTGKGDNVLNAKSQGPDATKAAPAKTPPAGTNTDPRQGSAPATPKK